MTKQILILFAHPQVDQSYANKHLMQQAKQLEHVTLVDLYAEYPTFDIDIQKEQQRLLDHDVIIFQHPLFWYSCPAILKEWQDLVLEYGFAYGSTGDVLKGKLFVNATTTGGPQASYCDSGANHYQVVDLLAPFHQMANLCQMTFLPPLIMYAARNDDDGKKLETHTERYLNLLNALGNDTLDIASALERPCLDSMEI